MRHFFLIIGYTRALFRDHDALELLQFRGDGLEGRAGSGASVMGRPTTMWEAPFAKAWAGVATRL